MLPVMQDLKVSVVHGAVLLMFVSESVEITVDMAVVQNFQKWFILLPG